MCCAVNWVTHGSLIWTPKEVTVCPVKGLGKAATCSIKDFSRVGLYLQFWGGVLIIFARKNGAVLPIRCTLPLLVVWLRLPPVESVQLKLSGPNKPHIARSGNYRQMLF